MELTGVVAIILIATLQCSHQIDSEDVSIDIANAARCRVRCLSLLQGRQPLPVAGKSSANVSLASCQQDPGCLDCSRPCNASLPLGRCEDACVDDVQSAPAPFNDDGNSCRESCRFLQRVNTIRPGTCPPETQAFGFAAVCEKTCDTDADCDSSPTTRSSFGLSGSPVQQQGDGILTSSSGVPSSSAVLLKCCSNGCGWTCQRPTHVHEGMPNVVDMPVCSERSSIDGVELLWRSVTSNSTSTGTLLYLVSSRSSASRHYSDNDAATPWQVIAQTVETQVLIPRLRPGQWYQFRVAAVNIYGSRGWSLPSQAFTLSRDPVKPDAPANLTEGDTTYVDGKVSVMIHWSEPKNTDLPIFRYKISWYKRLKTVSSQLQSLPEVSHGVPGDVHSFQLTDLEPDTTYVIHVQALARHSEVRMKGEKASLVITTVSPSRSLDQVAIPTVPVVTSGAFPMPVSPQDVRVESIYFYNGLLRANISWRFEEVDNKDRRCDKLLLWWSPEVCASEVGIDEPSAPIMSATSHEKHFVVYDLRFACRYLVRLQPVSLQRVTGQMSYVSLSTPYCWQADVVGGVRPDCPRNAARLPEEPINLNYSLIVGYNEITAKLTWSEPYVPAADPPLTGYQVVWGPVLPDTHHLLLDKSASETRELPHDIRSLVISLNEDQKYAAYVRAMSRYGLGRIASIRFKAPRLLLTTSTINNPPYVNVGTRSNILGNLSPTPTTHYMFVGYSPSKRDPNRPFGQQSSQQQIIAVPAPPPVDSTFVSSTAGLPHSCWLSSRTLLLFGLALIVAFICFTDCLITS